MTSKKVRARIRRLYVADSIYFITSVLANRQPLLAVEANMSVFRETLREVRKLYPFTMRAYVFLPDHFHLLIFVPESTSISKLMQSLHRNFTVNYKKLHHITARTKLWQPGFWDHVIRNEQDYLSHLDYIHYNPVKHGYVTCPVDYSHTSFHDYVQRSWYDVDWGCVEPDGMPDLDFE